MKSTAVLCLAGVLLATNLSCHAALSKLRVSENGRFLVKEDNTPFFYLADTAWELFHRLNRADTEAYLTDRASKKFNVIQAVVLAELDGLGAPNANGHKPLIDNDPLKPDEKYFQDVDWVVEKAESLGMYVGMLPTWGDKVNKKWGKGPEIFNKENARAYGEWLGKRYKDKAIIWILGGDRPMDKPEHVEIIRAMAEGLRAGDGGTHLMTLHPPGRTSSSKWFHEHKWLDFNMFQSGHSMRNGKSWDMINADYKLNPVKPVIDGEPNYEDHPVRSTKDKDWFNDYDVRKSVYRSVFAGGAGVSYGAHSIWQFWEKPRTPVTSARTTWREALKLPASGQMQILRKLMESRPYLTRIQDQSLIVGNSDNPAEFAVATCDAEHSFAFIYTPMSKPLHINLGKLAGPLKAYWLDPRTGAVSGAGEHNNAETVAFAPPDSPVDALDKNRDWVLMLDVSARNYPVPN